jgi:hypothetical protein
MTGGKTSGLHQQRLLIEPLGRRQFASLVQGDGLVEQVLQGLAVLVHGRVIAAIRPPGQHAQNASISRENFPFPPGSRLAFPDTSFLL